MISRLLPRDEWHRLAGTELEAAASVLPADAQVLVIEDNGEIVGCWSVIPYVHVEGLWIAPAHRKRSSVGRRLLTGMRRVAQALGADVVLTAATDDTVRQLITEYGGVSLPGTHHVLPVRRPV